MIATDLKMIDNKCSLLTAADIHKHKGESRLKEVFSLIAEDKEAVQPDVVLMGGDYAGGGRPPRMGGKLEEWQPAYSAEELKNEIRDILGRDVNVFLTYGSHDLNAVEGNDGFFSGPADCGAYYIYGIPFCQMRYAYPEQADEMDYDGADRDDLTGRCAAEGVENFLKWAESLDDRKPLFIMSHMPVHAQRHDNLGAQIWCDALNCAAEKRSVYFFFAHNHHSEERPDAGPNYHFIRPGEVIPVQQDNKEEARDNLIRFTYLNAGYVIKGCATLITIESDDHVPDGMKITVKRYCTDS